MSERGAGHERRGAVEPERPTVVPLRPRRAVELAAESGRTAAGPPKGWLPPGKTCAICFSVDDVHPGRSADIFEAGGDLDRGVLGRVQRLAGRHVELRTSLCVTADWRARSPYPTRRLLAATPVLARRSFLAGRLPRGTMRVDRPPGFGAFLKSMARVEIVPHGLHHIQRGPYPVREFENASYRQSLAALASVDRIMAAAGLEPAPGHVPPGWEASSEFRRAMMARGLRFIVSARDIRTPIRADAVAAMSGLAGQPLIFPGMTEEGLVHIPVNFQATNGPERAFAILESGGLLSIKAHVARRVGRYTALDALDEVYCNYLDSLLAGCKARFGERIWWPSLTEVADRFAAAVGRRPALAAS